MAEFHYSTTLDTSAQYIVPVIGSAAGNVVKKVRITDIKVTCAGTARSFRVSGESGNYQDLLFDLPASSVNDFVWQTPYPINAVSSTGELRGIYASASGAGVKIAISGDIEAYSA